MKKTIIFGLLAISLVSLFMIAGCSNTTKESRMESNNGEFKEQDMFKTDYTSYNEAFKKVLFATGQEKEESSKLFNDFNNKWDKFYAIYRESKPDKYSNDINWTADLNKMNQVIKKAKFLVEKNQLGEAHKKLEELRPLWQEIHERNGVYSRGYYMTEFHEIMEHIIEYSEENNTDKIVDECPELKELWIKVGNYTDDIEDVRINDFNSKYTAEQRNIGIICNSALEESKEDILSQSQKLKSGFIQTYLVYG